MSNPMPAGLEPAHLWKIFDLIRSTPHGSGNEAELRNELAAWAEEHGLSHRGDEVGNLLIRLPATKGREQLAPTVLQGHLDMVCVKKGDSSHDFAKDGLDLQLDGEWLSAKGTTLGADNGIGVASALALADDPDAEHGPIEVLLTLDEERGLTGASGLKPGFFEGRRMLNLDSEEDGILYVGCAGGGDVICDVPMEKQPREEGRHAWRIQVSGLAGGHSGLEIHDNRANAIKCLARILAAVDEAGIDYRPHKIEGGTARNVIPSEARCGGDLAPEDAARLDEVVSRVGTALAAEYARTDPSMKVTLDTRPGCGADGSFTAESMRRLVRALLATPSGVIAMSGDVPGLVETSTNVGVIRTGDDHVQVHNCTRSSNASALDAVRQSIAALYALAGADSKIEGAYPGWQPNMESPLLALAREVFAELYSEPEVTAIHAGLECGLVGAIQPGMDMISFGPDIRGAHTVKEKVSVPSVGRFYAFLKALLARLD